MSLLLRRGALLENDAPLLADDAPLPTQGPALVSLARWQAAAEPLQDGRIGVLLPNTADVLALHPALVGRQLIALHFPGFADGRAYSQARLLRERCSYRGELRAVGLAVVRDQLQFMARSGFDAFLLRADQDGPACLAAFQDFSLAYQPASDALTPVLRRRRP